MASAHWIPAAPVALPKDGVSRALTSTMWWRLAVTFVLVEAAVWTPAAIRIPALLALLTLALLVHRVECSVMRKPGGRLSLPYEWLLGALAVCALAIGVASYNGALHPAFGSHTKLWFYPGYAVWALLQELLLQGIFFLSLERLLGTRLAIFAAALLFSVAHIPNLFLMAATFVGGLIFTTIYATTRNLLITGIAHAMLGLALAVSAPAGWTHGMLVGIDYVQGHAFTGATVSTNFHNVFTPASMLPDRTSYALGEPIPGSAYRA